MSVAETLKDLGVSGSSASMAEKLASLSDADRNAVMSKLSPPEQEYLVTYWPFWARKEQKIPEGDWITWLILAGRGFGKTRTGAETVRRWVRNNSYVNLIGATGSDVREIMVTGESGILAICPDGERPRYYANRSCLEWPNGAVSLLFSAEEPDRLRGKQHSKLWCDEIAAWRYPDAWDQAMFGLRLGKNPQVVATTTPRPTPLIRQIARSETTHITRGSTYHNSANLAKSFIDKIVEKYQGTRLGRQELNAEILEDVPGALWTREDIDKCKKAPESLPDFQRVVIAVDPSGARGEDDEGADQIGIVVAAKGTDGRAYVLADLTCRASPAQWGQKVADAYDTYHADCVVAERNYGGAMVEHVLKTADPNMPFQEVTASRGKVVRAEPIAALYEQGRVSHIGKDLEALEDQLCQFAHEGYLGDGSPDRADALVWALTTLMDFPLELNISSAFMDKLAAMTAVQRHHGRR